MKCNIHHWMRAYIGAVDHPYFAVTGADGTFEIGICRRAEYTIAAWQEKLGTQEQHVSLASSGSANIGFHIQRRVILAHIDVLACNSDCRMLEEPFRHRLNRAHIVST